MNEDHEMLEEIMGLRIVGVRLLGNVADWECVHHVQLNELCPDCARDLSFHDQIEGK